MGKEDPIQPASKSEAAHANYANPNTGSKKKTLLVLFHTTLRASFRLMQMLENAIGPGIQKFEAAIMNFK